MAKGFTVDGDYVEDNVVGIFDKKYAAELEEKTSAMGEFLIKGYNCQSPEDAFNVGMTAIVAGLKLVFLSSIGFSKEDQEKIKNECLRCLDIFKVDFKIWFKEEQEDAR